ncbi:MAG: ribosomal protein S18-alanine N-acetyltransferase [Dehalococcoidia bacterium]|nr:ribosomal protein S18-alanine N-acetyltransferase [Dehalococcoidia bacterium]
MSLHVREMRAEDLEQVRAVDLACFPAMVPPTNYRTELINPMAHYLVALDDALPPVEDASGRRQAFILGFTGLWLMAGEMHIINLAVHPDFRHRGIGERLLIQGIELAFELSAVLMTLEVRVSNTAAQALYLKYGFTKRGVRKGYYLDNREDAVIMTLDELHESQYWARFNELKAGYVGRWLT